MEVIYDQKTQQELVNGYQILAIFQEEEVSLNCEYSVSNTVLSTYLLCHQILIIIMQENLFYR